MERAKGGAKDPLLQLVGLFSSDITDGSTNHDQQIYGVGNSQK